MRVVKSYNAVVELKLFQPGQTSVLRSYLRRKKDMYVGWEMFWQLGIFSNYIEVSNTKIKNVFSSTQLHSHVVT